MDTRVSVAIYGTSLFLRAVATVLLYEETYCLIFFAESTPAVTIIQQNPALLLYQDYIAPDNRPSLLAAHIVLVEIDSQDNRITIFQYNKPPQQISVIHPTSLPAIFAQFTERGVDHHE